MPGLIEEIQRDAMGTNVPVDALLRRVKVAATKLQLENVEQWVNSELVGYTGELPPYRKPTGQLAGFSPYHGWQPIHVPIDEITEMLTTAHIAEPVATLQDMADRHSEGRIHFPHPPWLVTELNKIMNHDVPRAVVQLARGHVVRILDTVRNMALDWALEMEKQGVLGEGMTFDEREKAQAQSSTPSLQIGSIGNIIGNVGSGNSAGSIEGTQSYNDASVFEQIADAISAQVDSADERHRLLAAVERMEANKNDRSSFAAAYGEFMALAANHVSLLTPFLPGLLAFLN